MSDNNYFRLQFIIFALVSASFTNIYITQPVLPVLQNEFSANAVVVSFSVSAVILGIAVANLLSGLLTLVDKAFRQALILKDPTKVVEKLSVNYDTSVVLNLEMWRH